MDQKQRQKNRMKVGTQIYVEGIPNTLYGQQQTFGHDYPERPKTKRKIIILEKAMLRWQKTRTLSKNKTKKQLKKLSTKYV